MPRSFLMTCDRNLVDKVTPGNRVKIVGVLSILKGSNRGGDANRNTAPSVRISYIRVLGM